MSLDYYADAIDRIRAKHRSLIINLTTGPAAALCLDEMSHARPPLARRCCIRSGGWNTLRRCVPMSVLFDLNTMNSGGDVVMNTPANVRKMVGVIRGAGVMPELEIFDSGDPEHGARFHPARACWTAPACGSSCWA